MRYLFILFLIGFGLNIATGCSEQKPKESISELYLWSHNDYEQDEPLNAALDLGFQMIEADIHLIDGELYVIHDHPTDLQNIPLLKDLYLTPLKERVEKNNGEVLPGESLPFYLVIDVKTEAESTYRALLETLDSYQNLFYRKREGEWIDGPVRLLISGNRPSLTADSPDRMVFLDGRVPNLGNGFSSELYPLISDSWTEYFTWDGTGEIPDDELNLLREYVSKAHQEDKLIRFWGTKDNEEVWRTFINNGVDVINVDDIEGIRNFLDREYGSP